jgi:hypothetical protein
MNAPHPTIGTELRQGMGLICDDSKVVQIYERLCPQAFHVEHVRLALAQDRLS